MPENSTIFAVILAGGQGSRLGGHKPAQALAGRCLLDHVRECLAPQVRRLAIVTKDRPDMAQRENWWRDIAADPKYQHAPLLRDAAPGRPSPATSQTDGYDGPLRGILAGLEWCVAAMPPPQFMLTAPVDTPFLPRDLVACLLAALPCAASSLPILRVRCGGQGHPLIALWPVGTKLSAHVRAHLATDRRSDEGKVKFPSLRAIQDEYGAIEVDFPRRAENCAPAGDPFFNINTPDDLARAEAIFSNLV